MRRRSFRNCWGTPAVSCFTTKSGARTTRRTSRRTAASSKTRSVGEAASSHSTIRTMTNRGVLEEAGTGGGTGRHESILRGADRAGRRVGRVGEGAMGGAGGGFSLADPDGDEPWRPGGGGDGGGNRKA